MIDDGSAGGVVKISNLGEDPAVLDLETAAILHIGRADPDLPVARPQLALGLHDESDPASYRPTTEGPEGRHFVRLFERMPGRAAAPGSDLDDRALRAYGETRPASASPCVASSTRGPAAASCGTPRTRSGCGRWCRRSPIRGIAPSSTGCSIATSSASPRAGRGCEAQVIHGDFTLDNVLARRPRPRGRASSTSATCATPPWSATSHRRCRSAAARAARDDIFASARIPIDGYAVAHRRSSRTSSSCCRRPAGGAARTIVSISAWRVRQLPGERRLHPGLGRRLLALLELYRRPRHRDAWRRSSGAARPAPPARQLAKRARREVLGSAITALTYSEPLHLRPRRGRVAVRRRRPQAARRLQQRPGRRPLPPAGDRGRRPPDRGR